MEVFPIGINDDQYIGQSEFWRGDTRLTTFIYLIYPYLILATYQYTTQQQYNLDEFHPYIIANKSFACKVKLEHVNFFFFFFFNEGFCDFVASHQGKTLASCILTSL